jgi:hypothetical protein
MLDILTQGGGKTVEENNLNKAEWLITADQVSYTPLHWLAYWNDYRSINFLFKTLDNNQPMEVIEKII